MQLRDTIPLDEFAGLKNNFTASGFEADFIVQLAKKAARYISPGSSKLPSGKYNLED